jgi:hypothetical protein
MFRLFSRRARPATRRPAARLCLDRLEDRSVPSTITLTAAPSHAKAGKVVTFSCHLIGDDFEAGMAGGTVTFKDGEAVLATVPAATRVTFSTADLAAGKHTIKAYYGGESINLGGGVVLVNEGTVSPDVSVVIREPQHPPTPAGPVAGVALPGTRGAVHVAVADVTGEGQADLVLAARSGPRVFVFVVDAATGQRRVLVAPTTPAGPPPALMLADADGDGDLDILLAGGRPIVVAFDGSTGERLI